MSMSRAVSDSASSDGSSAAGPSVRHGVPWLSPKRRRSLIAALCVVAGLIALLMVVYHNVVFGHWSYSYTNCLYRWKPFSSLGVATQGYCYSDITDNVLPIAYTTIHAGIFTSWVPMFSIGAPMTVNLYFSPLNYLYILPFDIAMPLIAVLKVVVAFLGMVFLMRQLGYSARGGFIAGTTYALSAAMVTWQGWPHTEVGMYAPWLFMVLDLLVKQLKVKYMVWTAVLTFLMLMAGMPTFAAYFLYLAFFYALFYACRRHWGSWRRLAATLACGIGSVAVGAVMSLPYTGELLTSVGSNGYSESRAGWSTIGLEWPQLKTLVFPFLATTATRNNIESMLYTGVLAVLTVALTVVHFRSKPRVGFFAISAIVVTLLLFTPALDIVFTHMPMVNTSYKFRIVILLNFALAVMLGINMDDLLTRVFDTMRDRVPVWVAAAIGAAGFAAIALRTRGLGLQENGYGALQRRLALAVVIVFLLVVIARTCLTGVLRGRAAQALSIVCTIALCGSVVVDTGYFAAQYVPLVDKSAPAVPPATSTITYLQEHTKNGEKIVSKNVDFPVDSPMFYGLRDIRGHGLSMTNEDIMAYYNAIDETAYKSSPTNTVFLNVRNENLLRYMGVKYIVSSPNQEDTPEYSSGEGMTAVGDDGLLVKDLGETAPEVQLVDNAVVYDTNADVLADMGEEYRTNTVFFSREYGVPDDAADGASTDAGETDGSGDVDTTSGIENVQTAGNGNMTITVSTTAKKYLVVAEYADTGWNAYIDGQKTDLYKGNGLFRTVEVPAGKHTVELKYEPTTQRLFFIATGVGAVLLVAAIVCSRKENELLAAI
ncbi:YfhO family protein [Bifidobacterium amazonense]|uniref:YfhO family protein n=1 Tax=Bifidobacterium amazonense TaxID=2809027 RepID=A0ABS9VTN0_9BIFI|nr:YfhO family protein [Bifidobacterium amazonense]MCH9275440.1 YfhO family protein [Bifidobacterium amazonense]